MNMKVEKTALNKVILFSIVSIIYSIISFKIIEYLKLGGNIGGMTFKSTIQEIFIGLIFGPIIETFIFQFAIYKIVFYFKKSIQKYFLKTETQFSVLYILISCLLFAISHSYSLLYTLLMIIPGAILAYSFYFFKKNYMYPILYTFFIHLLHNSFVFIADKI